MSARIQCINMPNAVLYSAAASATVVNAFDAAILALSPTNYWKFNEDYGSTTFVDTQGNGNLASSGITVAGINPIVPAQSDRGAVTSGGLGKFVAGSSSTANFGSGDFTILVHFTQPEAAELGTNFLFAKSPTTGSGRGGIFFITFSGSYQLNIGTDDSNYKQWSFTAPVQGSHQLVLRWNATTKAASMDIDGAPWTLTAGSSAGTVGSLSNSELFCIGARGADSFYWPGAFQSCAVWTSTRLSDGNVSSLYSAYNTALVGSHTLPVIIDFDGAATDRGDLFDIAQAIAFDQIGIFDLKGVVVTTNDNYGAPAMRDILDGRGQSAVPVYAYQGTDVQAATAGQPAQRIRDNFSAADVRSNYTDPATGYAALLNAASDNSVVVTVGGFFNSIAQFLNASGANVTLWNQKVRATVVAAGQWPNSSTAASPAGNFTSTSVGEWNLGGSSTGGAAESQAAVDFITKNTQPVYWAGVEICGNTGDVSFGYDLTSDLPDIGVTGWPVTDPLAYGWNSQGARTAWDQVNGYLGVLQLLRGTNPLATVTNISDPTISTSSGTYGQNSSSGGSAEHFYFVPRTTGMTSAQWRTMMQVLFKSQGVPK